MKKHGRKRRRKRRFTLLFVSLKLPSSNNSDYFQPSISRQNYRTCVTIAIFFVLHASWRGCSLVPRRIVIRHPWTVVIGYRVCYIVISALKLCFYSGVLETSTTTVSISSTFTTSEVPSSATTLFSSITAGSTTISMTSSPASTPKSSRVNFGQQSVLVIPVQGSGRGEGGSGSFGQGG